MDKDPGLRAPEHHQREEALRRAILAYCVEHPDAKDTLEGILRWWFNAGECVWHSDEVKAALDQMKAKGWITGRKLQHSEEIYGISKEKLTEIQAFLRGSAALPKGPLR